MKRHEHYFFGQDPRNVIAVMWHYAGVSDASEARPPTTSELNAVVFGYDIDTDDNWYQHTVKEVNVMHFNGKLLDVTIGEFPKMSSSIEHRWDQIDSVLEEHEDVLFARKQRMSYGLAESTDSTTSVPRTIDFGARKGR